MKIFSGTFKGCVFQSPRDIRPTQGLVRKAVFDILNQDLSEMSFLDCFAGSGAVGLEALSRGAKNVCWLEKEFVNIKFIQNNIKLLRPYCEKSDFQWHFFTTKGVLSEEKKFFMSLGGANGTLSADKNEPLFYPQITYH